MYLLLIEACYYDEKEKNENDNKKNCVGHSIFLVELPSNNVVVEKSNKRLFLKVERWALICELGVYSRGVLIDNFTSRVGAYSRGALI